MENFCKNCRFLLEPNPSSGKLKYKCDKCGETTEATDESTILINEDLTAADKIDKYKHTIATTAYDPISAKIFIPEGCPSCGRTIASYQLLGDKKKMVIVCICGHST
jgi:DNA-directed RNA polymerase subunit M/transcription elongation factor TFIIS